MTRLLSLLLLVVVVVSAAGLSSANFVCPQNLPCYCMKLGDDDDKQKVHCTTSESQGSAFDLTINTPQSLRVQCVNSPDWSDFLLGANLRIGNVENFHYVGCQLPGAKFSEAIVAQLGIDAVKYLKIDKLQGNVSRKDLDVFPQLEVLVMTGNQLGNVPVDLLYGIPNLTKLELRNTQVKLQPGFFNNSQSLTALELSHNDLHDLKPGVFDGLESIQLLNVWGCNIGSLDPQVFRGLSTLLSLDIKMNNLRELPADIFHDMIELKVINFGMNNFTELPGKLFSRNEELKVIKLTHNRVNLTTLPDKFLGDLIDLQVVSLERMGLLNVPENLFWGSKAIVEININRNYLTTLPANLLRDARQLYKLSLSFNDLQTLPRGLFASLKKLVILDLSRNHLSMIDEHLFNGLDALQELNIEQNDLKFIDVDAFVSLVSLRIAMFSNNQLTLRTDLFDLFGQVSPFHGCKNLEELDLSHNNITEVFSDWTVGHFRLRQLNLSYNSLEYLQTEDLQFVSNRLQVDMTHNSISTVDLSRLEYIAAEQTSPREVVINLNFNPIRCNCDLYSLLRYTNGEMRSRALDFVTLQVQHLTCDGPDYMQGARLLGLKALELKCLVEDEESESDSDPCAPGGICNCWLRPVDKALILDCAARNITEAPELFNTGNAAVVEIDLSGNLLKAAPYLTNSGYEKVRYLNLSNNEIEFINESLISPDLRVLNLEGNHLSFIDREVLAKISNSSIYQLTLSDNPWKCECENVALLEFVQDSYRLIPDRHNMSCALTNLSISSLHRDDLCPNDFNIIIVSIVAVLGAFVCAIVGICCWYRRHIKIYLYSKNLCLGLITEDELDKDKIWDAFISYSHQDEDFVIDELVKQLEDGPKPYKLCIHGRDWIAGDWIPNNILRSVVCSRRTIIVLSPHFIESEWGRMEFQTAHKKALSDKCARVIVVLYGDIDPAKIEDPDLRNYLKMNTYVKWGDPWFYQKLRYALPHKTKMPTEITIDEWQVDAQEEFVQVKIL